MAIKGFLVTNPQGDGTKDLFLDLSAITDGQFIKYTAATESFSGGDVSSNLTLANGKFFVGNGSNVATGVTMSGDATITNAGVLTLKTVNASPGTYTVSTITVDAQGRVTAASNGAGSGITTLNTLNGATQTFATGTTGTDFAISSAGTTHTFNIPDASATARGLVTTGTQTFAGTKTFGDTVYIRGTGTPGTIYGSGSNNAILIVAGSDQSVGNGGYLQFGTYNANNVMTDNTTEAYRWRFYDKNCTGLSFQFITDSGIGGSYWGIKVGSYGSTFQGPLVYFEKSRGTFAAQTTVANTDRVGGIVCAPYDGASYIEAATVLFEVDGTVTQGAALPTRIKVNLTPAGSETIREVYRFNNLGDFSGQIATATNMASGFICIPSAAGAPSGTPTLTGITAGHLAMYYDSTNNKFYVYNGAWKGVTLA